MKKKTEKNYGGDLIGFLFAPILYAIIIVVVGFGIYAFLGFTDWLFTDPFNWIN